MTSSPRVPLPESPGPPPLPRDLILFFIQFSVALNKTRAYPPGHPVLTAALDVLLQHVGTILQRRDLLAIGVSRNQLMVDGAASDDDHPVLGELAERLHRHQLAAVQLRPGLNGTELSALLQALSTESWRQGKPLGLEPLDTLAGQWPHVALEPLPLDQLELGDRSGTPREHQAEAVWHGLVNAALTMAQAEPADGAPAPPAVAVSGEQVVAAIKSPARRLDQAYHREVLEWVVRAAEQAGRLEEGAWLRRELDRLFAGLDRATFQHMLDVGTSAAERKELIKRGARVLPVKPLFDLVMAASVLAGQSTSRSLLSLLGKLARHTDDARGPVVVGAEEVLRDSIRHLITEWDEEDPEGHSHRDLLALLARPADLGGGGTSGRAEVSALPVAQMGLELGVDSSDVQQALLAVRAQLPVTAMLDLIDRGTQAGLAVDALWKVTHDSAYLGSLLLNEDQDVSSVERLLDQIGAGALSPLLDALEHAQSASRRRWLMRRLQELGEMAGSPIAARLPGKPWYVQRNLLILLGGLRSMPAEFSPEPYTRHDDPRVRREAYKLLVAQPEWRTESMVRAAGDQDPGIVRLALSAALEDCPAELIPRILEHLVGRYRDPDIRLLAIRLIGQRPTTGGREWLIRRVASKRGWGFFRRFRLEPKSLEVMAALVILNRTYADHADAAAVLRMAEASKDAEVRAAGRGIMPRAAG